MGVCLHKTRQIVHFVVGLEDARVAVLLQEGKKRGGGGNMQTMQNAKNYRQIEQ